MHLSDEDRREMKADGMSAARREDFRAADRITPPMPFDVYLNWLTEMSRLFPQETRTEIVDYKRSLL